MRTTFGWLSRAAVRASRSVRARSSSRSVVGEPGRRHDLLDRDVAVQHLVARQPDPAHAAGADQVEQPVATRDQQLMHCRFPLGHPGINDSHSAGILIH